MSDINIDGQILKKILQYGYSQLQANKDVINDLNVFPIPDGDTGDNMCMTLQGGVKAIAENNSYNVCDIASSCASGMLNSARGNSGVILSQLFYGFAEGLNDKNTAGIIDILHAMESGVKRGYAAVDKPTEGTMLTVARETTEHISKLNLLELSESALIKELLESANNSVLATPEKLPVLKESGVVDSGGAGIYYIFEGISRFVNGEELSESKEERSSQELDFSRFNENSTLEYGYCSEVLLQLTRSKTDIDNFNMDELKAYLQSIGDSIVAVQTGYVIKIHVHTFEPYRLLQYCQQFGEFLRIKIENMTLQHSDANIENRFAPSVVKSEEKKKYGLVTVASGEGVVQLFKDLGVDVVVSGGQTNNPSTEDFIEAFDEVNAEEIFVLPNNSNIILTAKQAAEMYDKAKIHVVMSRSIGDGYAALSMIDLTLEDSAQIVDNMHNEIINTTTGAISRATRSTVCCGINITKDDAIGIIGKQIVSANADKTKAIAELIDNMRAREKECGVLIFGKDLTEEERSFTREYFARNYSDIELYEIDGKQDIYDLYVILN